MKANASTTSMARATRSNALSITGCPSPQVLPTSRAVLRGRSFAGKLRREDDQGQRRVEVASAARSSGGFDHLNQRARNRAVGLGDLVEDREVIVSRHDRQSHRQAAL